MGVEWHHWLYVTLIYESDFNEAVHELFSFDSFGISCGQESDRLAGFFA